MSTTLTKQSPTLIALRKKLKLAIGVWRGHKRPKEVGVRDPWLSAYTFSIFRAHYFSISKTFGLLPCTYRVFIFDYILFDFLNLLSDKFSFYN